jgi:glucose/arabinose dehydrogenase
MMLAALAACGDSNRNSPMGDSTTVPGDAGGMTDGGSGSGSGSGSGMGDGSGSGMGSGSGTGDGSGSGTGSGAPPEVDAAVCSRDGHGIMVPEGFCATVYADHAGRLRHIAVSPSGHVFAVTESTSPTANDGHVVSLFDADNDGVAEQMSTFGDTGGNGIAWKDDELYVAANDRIVAYCVNDGDSAPTSLEPTVLVSGLPADGDHPAKTVVVQDDMLYVNFGSPSNACQLANRQPHSPGKDPCDELDTRAGIWEFSSEKPDQTMACGTRIATGMRNTNAMALDGASGMLWGAINGRDQLSDNWPELFTPEQDKVLPSDEVVAITDQLDRGWPYCYHDAMAGEMKLAPEYGGDGAIAGRCSAIPSPDVALPAHSAPLGMVFVTGTQFPPAFRYGALIANHGSRFDATAPAAELHGYDVEFIAFDSGRPTGTAVPFATGFDAGMRPLPEAAPHRPVGLAMMPDGSLLIGDDVGGRIWRVYYTGH